MTDFPTPIWLLNAGLSGVYKEKDEIAISILQFEELTIILKKLEEDARFFGEDAYRIVAERRSRRNKN